MDRFGNINSSSRDKPAIVIVGGAWHVPAHYEPMAKPLREAGFQVVIPHHQSIGISKDPGDALKNDAAAIARVIEHIARLRKDVIVFMHSYGGICGSDAVGMLCEAEPRNPAASRIKRLVYLAAHFLDKNASMFASRDVPGIDINEDGMCMHMKPYERYYPEVPREDAEPALNLLQRMAFSVGDTPTQYAGWKDYKIPVTYIKCSLDTAVTLELADTYLAKARDAGVEVDEHTIEAGHCAHFTAPSLVVGVLEKVISAMPSE